jgi:hypothetical protein
MSQAIQSVTTIPTRSRRPRTAAPAAKLAAKPASPEYVNLYLGDEHWVAAAIPAADQLIILANRDRAELSRMVAAWQTR